MLRAVPGISPNGRVVFDTLPFGFGGGHPLEINHIRGSPTVEAARTQEPAQDH